MNNIKFDHSKNYLIHNSRDTYSILSGYELEEQLKDDDLYIGDVIHELSGKRWEIKSVKTIEEIVVK